MNMKVTFIDILTFIFKVRLVLRAIVRKEKIDHFFFKNRVFMGYFFTARFSYACTISSKFGKSCYFLARCILMLAVAATYLKINAFHLHLKVQHIQKILYF